MKRIRLILGFTLIASIAFGQSLFFDHLNNSSWAAASSWNDSVVKKAREIPLGKLISKDSLKQNVTIWNFRDSSLVITHYDHTSKKETEVVSYKCKIDKDKGKLTILPDNSNAMIYGAGITSTGNNVILFREKYKSKKR